MRIAVGAAHVGPGRADSILGSFDTPDIARAWAEFLDAYSPVLLQVVRLTVRDEDAAADCYLFVCEHLSRDGCRRLRSFRAGGAATFTTWLRVVTRNICLDWWRREYGRLRVFESIKRLPAREREVFALIFEQRMTAESAYSTIAARDPSFSPQELELCQERIRAALSPRQWWLIQQRNQRRSIPSRQREEEAQAVETISDPAPSPETLAQESERSASLQRGLRRLTPSDRLLIRLRYEEELTLEAVAGLTGLKDAQAAHRRIETALERLRAFVK